jgi:hypothetical protein
MPKKKKATKARRRISKRSSPKAVASKRLNRTKTFFSARREGFLKAYQTDVKFRRSISHKTRKDFQKTYEEKIKSEMLRFYRRNRGKRRGNEYIFRVSLTIHRGKKKFKQNLGAARFKVRSEKSLRKYFDRNLKFMIKKMGKYLDRPNTRSVSVTGFKAEVVRRGARPKTNRSRKSKRG